MLSVHAPDYTHPEFVLNRAHTFTITFGDTAPPLRYRGKEYPPAAAGTVTVVQPDEVVQSLLTGPTAAYFATFALLDPQPLLDVTADGELPIFDRLTYTDRDLFSGFAMLHTALTDGTDDTTLRSMFASVLARLVSRHATAARATSEAHRPAALRQVRQTLSERLDTNIGLDELAAAAGYSRHHLLRRFRQAYGVPPHRYRTLLRLATARPLLAQGVSATEVAARLGYYDQSQLNRHFREALGISAGAYARADADAPSATTNVSPNTTPPSCNGQ
ncbi:AraC family transcriptional regulator [Actinoplanes sp. NBRC 103695]|uniref:helix-turn-helix domain-containing protein n=1 Tax=Actinoplanes sp. NBRC 103695 TaxID=3032202 RepID=UPI0024A207AB|nr:AraC family transcriptional regulator [Actinoplanes sp. NBRC 103695]GLZ02451.1 AraC family transcriptional regulator [Actinoplanes sp. NBRC 103695]